MGFGPGIFDFFVLVLRLEDFIKPGFKLTFRPFDNLMDLLINLSHSSLRVMYPEYSRAKSE
jgi:hypothetical protein